MALVNLPTRVSFTLVDETGSRSQMEVGVGADATLADIRTAADELVPLIEAASDCTVEGYSISASTIETAPVAPAAGSRVERKANITFRTAAGKVARVTVPGIIGAAVLSSGRVDEDNAAVGPLLLDLLAAPWTDSNGSDLSAVTEVYETYRTTRKSQLPSARRIDAGTTPG
ncbi:MAG TPA: hypothetical protein VFS21_35980 [Roseiflexaceae bacterium]|nr:hypothetical protein [Roseiflexaceae bacterium]